MILLSNFEGIYHQLSGLLDVLLASLLLDLLGLSCLGLLLLHPLPFSLLPVLFGLHEVAVESDLFLQIDALCKVILIP